MQPPNPPPGTAKEWLGRARGKLALARLPLPPGPNRRLRRQLGCLTHPVKWAEMSGNREITRRAKLPSSNCRRNKLSLPGIPTGRSWPSGPNSTSLAWAGNVVALCSSGRTYEARGDTSGSVGILPECWEASLLFLSVCGGQCREAQQAGKATAPRTGIPLTAGVIAGAAKAGGVHVRLLALEGWANLFSKQWQEQERCQ
jgi:hypothetical protein